MAIKILYVDDNEDTLFYIKFMLQRRGYEVTTALGGAEALERVRETHPDVLLADVLMPQMDGYELTRAIRQDQALAHLPVILFSAAAASEHKAKGFEAGADDYLTKPILNDELDNRIQSALKLTEVRRVTMAQPVSVPKKKTKGRVIGYWGCKGGVGVTSLAVNTAIAFSQNARVIIADMNVGMGSIVLQMKLPITDIPRSPWSMEPDKITREVVKNALLPYSDSLSVLLMSEGERWSPTIPFVDTVLHYLQAMADWVILDLGAGVTPDKFPVLLGCDHVVLVSGSTRIASALTEYAVESATSLNIPREQLSVVMIQRRDTSGYLTPELLESHLRIKLDSVIPIAKTEALQAFEQGTPVVSALPTSRLANSYLRLAQVLGDKLKAQE